MKKLLFILALFVFAPALLWAQFNHVPNGNFEDYSGCPGTISQMSICNFWYSYSPTPDYFNACNKTTGDAGVPHTWVGYQYPLNGNGFAGFYCGSMGGGEMAGVQITSLKPNKGYKLSLFVNRSNYSPGACNQFGVYLFSSTLSKPTKSTLPLNKSQLVLFPDNGYVYDTLNWVQLSTYFVADTTHNHLVIDGWDTSKTNANFSYYYVDSVTLTSFDTFYVKDLPDTNLCNNQKFDVSYISSDRYTSSNIMTVQLSDMNGTFSQPINIGQKTLHDTTGTISCIIPANIISGSKYRIRVIASNSSDTSRQYTRYLSITNLDSISLKVNSNSPVCEKESLNLSVSGMLTPSGYIWSGPISFNSTAAKPSIREVLPVHAGKYYVALKFYGCEIKDTIDVAIKPAPAIPTVSNNSPICEGDTLKLTGASTTPGVTYSWAGPDNFTSAVQNPLVEKAAPSMQGNYTITATSDGCTSSATTSVQVKSLPMAVALSSNSPICEGGTLQVRSTSSNTNATYNWTGPDTFTAFVQNPTGINMATPTATGWYKMLVGVNGCYYRDSILAVVNTIPGAPTVTYNNPICAGETLNLSPENINGATYNWSGPNGYTSALQNASKNNIQTTDGGVYKVKATVNGCTSADGSVTVIVNPTPFVVIMSNPIDSICKGENVLFTPIPNNHGGTPTYQWFVNNQLSGIGTSFSTASLNDKDIIRCDMTEYTKCNVPHIDESNYITMSVISLKTPSVSITANPTTPLKLNEYVTFTAVPVDAGILPKYQWMRNGQNIVGATGSTWSANTLNDNDKITVLVTSDYKCPQPTTAVSNIITVRVLSGINKMGTAAQLELYPNPNKGSFTLKVTEVNLSNAVTIEVLNTLGQTVYTNKIKPTSANWQQGINIDNAADGLYLLRLHTDTGIALLKFTVAR